LNRRLEIGDKFSLYEWMDHMLSQSSNAAASQVWKKTVLLREFGVKYPQMRTPEGARQADAWLATVPQAERIAGRWRRKPMRSRKRADTNKLRVGTFSPAAAAVSRIGQPRNAERVLRWLVRLSRLVDAVEPGMKRLLYFARPRYRYASSPALTMRRCIPKADAV
jgi:hypothetical protein